MVKRKPQQPVMMIARFQQTNTQMDDNYSLQGVVKAPRRTTHKNQTGETTRPTEVTTTATTTAMVIMQNTAVATDVA